MPGAIVHELSNALAFGIAKGTNAFKLNFTGTAANQALTSGKLYRIVASEACFYSAIITGTDPAVTTNGVYLPADTIDFVALGPAEDALSVISNGTNGFMSITAMEPLKGWVK